MKTFFRHALLNCSFLGASATRKQTQTPLGTMSNKFGYVCVLETHGWFTMNMNNNYEPNRYLFAVTAEHLHV